MTPTLWLAALCLAAAPDAGGGSRQAAPAPLSVPPRPFQSTPPLHTIVLPVQGQPVVDFRLVFRSGSVDDPKGREGLTALAAELMTRGGTRELNSAQLLEALFPMAAELGAATDKQLTVFSGRVHRDHLERFLELFLDVLLEPRWDEREFERLRGAAVNRVRNGLRGEDDETLGKVALDALLFENHPYRHFVGGTVAGLTAANLAETKAHAARVFTQDRLILGLGGAVDEALAARVRARLSALPATGAPAVALPAVTVVPGRALVLQKETLSTAISLGVPYGLRRGDPDFYRVAFALAYLGEHRQFHGVLFDELREKRGLNYGNYAYAEHFHQEGWSTLPRVNVGRSMQDYSIWIRPVEPTNALFATKGAMYFFDQLVRGEIDAKRFETMRGFMQGYTRLWEQTPQRRLGYLIDDALYGTTAFLEGYRQAIAKVTPEEVAAAVQRHLHPGRMSFAFVTREGKGLADALARQPRATVRYASPKAKEVLEADQRIAVHPLPIQGPQVRLVEANAFMER